MSLYLGWSWADRGLVVHLREPDGIARPARVGEINGAATQWAKRRGVPARPAMGQACPPDREPVELREYLYADGSFNQGRYQRHLDDVHDHGSLHHYSLRPGISVEGRDLFGRQTDLDRVDALLADTSVHLRAPRRYGKTSAAQALVVRRLAAGQPAIHVDLTERGSVVGLVVELALAARSIGVAIASLRAFPADADPTAIADAAEAYASDVVRDPVVELRRVLSELKRASALVVLDEFSVFLRTALQDSRGPAALSALREAREAGLRFLVCGSQGLSAWVEYHHAGAHLTALTSVDLGPLGDEAGRHLTEELLYGCGRRPFREGVGAVIDCLGSPVPYFVHALADAVRADTAPNAAVDADVVRKAYTWRLLASAGNGTFRPFALPQQTYPGQTRQLAFKLLRRIAAGPDGAPHDDLVALGPEVEPLLACLSEDYDLVSAEGRVWFRSKVLRDRWARREAWLTGPE